MIRARGAPARDPCWRRGLVVRFPSPIERCDMTLRNVGAGVYTLRLAYQPEDGDHMGTAPYAEFALACPAAEDKNADTMEAKALHELSAQTTKGHPSVWVLFPGKDAAEPKLVNKGD